MRTIQQVIHDLKDQKSFHEKRAKSFRAQHKEDRAKKHEGRAEDFQRDIDSIEHHLLNPPATTPAKDKSLFTLEPGDLEKLSEEFRDELGIDEGDELELNIKELLQIAGRPLGIKELMIGLYKLHGLEVARNTLTAKLYRMNKKELISSPARGTYTLLTSAEEEQEAQDRAAEEWFEALKDDRGIL